MIGPSPRERAEIENDVLRAKILQLEERVSDLTARLKSANVVIRIFLKERGVDVVSRGEDQLQ